MVDPNTRQGKRTPVTLKIKFKSETLEQFIERYAVDVSQGGIFIRTKEPLAVGTQMKFEFQLRDASPLIAGEGTVVWTREHDPSRPAIAPGMGVRFDRLADGSQGVLERILTEKAKQAPQRPASETAKPQIFTDTPTRVAPAPMQEALLGRDPQRQRRLEEQNSDQITPLPKPMPFHSDADEFPDEAFEEATKVRALDELIAQTADGAASQDELARRNGARGDATAPEPISDRAETRQEASEAKPAARSDVKATAAPAPEIPEVPELPTPPEPAARPAPKLLDTSPSPRTEPGQPPPAAPSESLLKTRPGVEPARTRSVTPPQAPPAMTEAPPLAAPAVRAVAAEPTAPARMPSAQPRSSAPLWILLLVLVAAAGAAVWFFVLRPQATEDQRTSTPSTDTTAGAGGSATAGSAGSATAGSAAPAPESGSAVPEVGSGSAAVAATGSAAPPAPEAPKAELVDTVIAASADGAKVEITGTDQAGPAPLTAKLEKDKPYKARVTAPGFAALELDIKGGADKQTAKLVAKPRVIAVVSDPPGALVYINGTPSGHTTPYEVELTKSQAARKTARVQLRKSGFKTLERIVDLSTLTEEDNRMVTKLEEKLVVQPVVAPPRTGGGQAKGSGADAGSGSASEGTPSGSEQGSASGGSETPPPPPAPPAPAGGSNESSPASTSGSTPSSTPGSAAEPEPAFNKQP